MKKYKYLLGVGFVSLFSEISASAVELAEVALVECTIAAKHVEAPSPVGHHGTRHGGMMKGLPTSESAANLEVTRVYPSALQFLIHNDDGTDKETACFSINSETTIYEIEQKVIDAYRLTGGIKFLLNGQEVMKSDVQDGALVKVIDAFAGNSGILHIEVVKDNTRSPLHSAMATPEPVTSSDESESLPSSVK